MSESLTFKQAKKKYLKTLEQYVPVVDRVHGGHHPEFHDVRAVFNEINDKVKTAEFETPDLNSEFARLREITNNYEVPGDVCESYEAVYNMLAELDKAANA
ncbi:MAG TPA: iron-sulfur cluster repair di-iron protein, ric [Clostridiales bacterium]|nr:iron-sulfur cluster repair di-iron protein, ric [Clostridiales bacterium]